MRMIVNYRIRRIPSACRTALPVRLCAIAIALTAPGLPAQTAADLERLAALESELASLETEITRLEDSKAIKRLQRAYGYYVDQKRHEELAALFSADATVELSGMGVYIGRDRIAEFYERLMGGPIGPGELYNHMILQGVVNVSEDGSTANGRWRALIQTGEHGESASWAEGPYENEYVKENGVWRFSKVHWYQTVAAPYDPGWHLDPTPIIGPLEDIPPDTPPTEVYESFPGGYLTPFHYDNPVTGRTLPDVE